MVLVVCLFGLFSKGNMDIKLDKASFSAGESIIGTVTMQLKKPIKSRGVVISIIGERKVTRMAGNGLESRVEQVFNFDTNLDGEKEYITQPYEYKFELKAPQQNQAKAPEGALGAVVNAASFLTVGSAGPISWYLIAKLDVPKGFDLSKKVKIMIA